MKPVVHAISLLVEDLQKATAFYRDALGLTTHEMVEGVSDHVVFELQGGLSLVLYLRSEFAKLVNESVSTASSQVILSHFTQSKEEAAALLNKAVAAAATLLLPAREEDWGGYGGNFRDPDGHIWEIMYNPHYA